MIKPRLHTWHELKSHWGFGVSRHLPLFLAISLLAACSSNGCGCDGFEARDFPAEHYDKTTPQTMQIRLTPSGLDFVEGNLQPIINEAVPGGLNFCLPKDDTSSTKLCFANQDGVQPTCDDGSQGCQISLSIDGAQIKPVPNNRLEVDITIGNVNPVIPFSTDVAVLGEVTCDVTAYKKGADRMTPATIQATLPIDFNVDQMSPLKDTRIKLGELALNLDDVDFHLRGNWKCGTATALRSLFRNTIENLLKDQLKSTIEDLTRQNLCRQCGEGLSACPDNAMCAEDGACQYNGSEECVPALLGVEGRLMLGDLLSGYTETPDASTDLTVRLADYAKVDTGVSLAMRTGFQPEKIERCVPVDPSTRPAFTTIPISPTVMANTKPNSNDPFMMGIGVHKRTIEHMLWSVWASGATCLAVGSDSLDVLSTSSLALLVRSLGDLADGKKRAVEIKIVPQKAPLVTLGANSVEEVMGKLVIKDGLMNIDWKDFDINIYGYVQDRHALLFTVRTDLLLPIALVPDAGGKLQVVIGEVDKALTNLRILNHKLLKESPEVLKDALPTLLGVALPQLASSLDGLSFDLPEFFGFRVDLKQGDVTSIDNNTFIGLFANLTPVTMMALSGNQSVDTQIFNASVRYPEASASGFVRPEVTLQVGAKVPSLDWPLPADQMEFSYRVNGGFWSLFQPTDKLELNDPVFALSGDHLIEVRARPRGEVESVDMTPERIKVRVDYTAPALELEYAQGKMSFIGQDEVDAATALTYRWRTHDGESASQWSEWMGQNTLELNTIEGDATRLRVEVEVRDTSGHVTKRDRTVERDVLGVLKPAVAAAEPQAKGCSAAPGQRSPGNLGLMMFLGMMGFGVLGRRRARQSVLAMISALGLMSVGVGCTDDQAAQKSTCDPTCANDQVCKAGTCVAADNKCNADADCGGDGKICLEGVCSAPECSDDSACAGACGDDKRGTCASGKCACEDFCPEGCGDGELCCFPSNSCKPIPDACDGKVCEPGFEPKITTEGSPDGKTCAMAGAVCDCVELPPLPLGAHGRYPDIDTHQNITAVSAYNQTYQDLMVGVVNGNQATWQFVDGVPATGEVSGSLNGPRQGIKTPGPKVGEYTALTFDDAGTLHVFYRDSEAMTLKYARGTKKGEGFTFETTTLANDAGSAGIWTRTIFAGGKVHVVYTADSVPGTTGHSAQIRHFSFDPSADLASVAATAHAVVLEGAASSPCGERCVGGASCFAEVGACAMPSQDCATACGDGTACTGGACKPIFNDSAPASTPIMTGQFLDLSATPDGLLLVFYDGEQKSAGWAKLVGDAWEMPSYVGTPSGPYASGLTDAQGNVHLAYMDEFNRRLMYEQVGKPAEVIVDGLRDTGTQWLLGRIGEDVTLRVKGDGSMQVVYHDATLQQLMEATRQANGQWKATLLASPGEPYVGEHGFYATIVRRAGASTIVEYVINNQTSPVQSKPIFYTLP